MCDTVQQREGRAEVSDGLGWNMFSESDAAPFGRAAAPDLWHDSLGSLKQFFDLAVLRHVGGALAAVVLGVGDGAVF